MFKSTLALVAVLGLSAALATPSVAASVKCTVSKVSGNTAILDCGNKAAKLTVGTDVKVRTAKKKAIEGC
jgi:hypothetical protein